MVCFLAIILICVKGVWVIYVIHLYLWELKYKGNYNRCRSPTKSGSWGLGMSSCKAQRRSRSCINWFENRTAQGTNTPKVGESSDSPFLFGNSGGWGVTDGKHGQVVALFGLHRKLMHRFCDSVDNLLGVQLLL